MNRRNLTTEEIRKSLTIDLNEEFAAYHALANARSQLVENKGVWKTHVLSKDELIKYIQLSVIKHGTLRQCKLLPLIHNYGHEIDDPKLGKLVMPFNAEDLEKILPEILNNPIDIIKWEKHYTGRIIKSGDGIRGIAGNGPITFKYLGAAAPITEES